MIKVTTEKTMRGYHFSNGYLNYGDGREIVKGMTLACDPDKIELCSYGFHASEKPLNALSWIKAPILSIVECGGKIIYDDDKFVASQRRHVYVFDATRLLHEFALWCAEEALKLINNPDQRSLNALNVKRQWLAGEATDEELADAFEAACAAARAAADAATYADYYAARAAAHTADAVYAAYDAAAYAAYETALAAYAAADYDAAVYAAARAAAENSQNEKLTAMIEAELARITE